MKDLQRFSNQIKTLVFVLYPHERKLTNLVADLKKKKKKKKKRI